MKAVIPVAGIGTKLRPHTHTQPKALVPVAGKPILSHIIDPLIEHGISDFLFITGYLRGKIEDYISSKYGNRSANIEYVVQEPKKGTGHAIWCGRDYIRDEKEILIMLGDTILDMDFEQMITSDHSCLGIRKVNKPGLFGVAQLDENGYVKNLVEKPAIPKSNLALAGIYKITNPALLVESTEFILENRIKPLGEYQLTDALMRMIEQGEKFVTLNVDNWFDCGKKESVLEANAILMNRPGFKSSKAEDHSKTIIVPPVSIGKNCKISNSIIGPNVALGDNTTVSYSIVKNTIVGSFSELQSAVLENSIIGNDTTMKGLSHSLNIGDNTEINFTN